MKLGYIAGMNDRNIHRPCFFIDLWVLTMDIRPQAGPQETFLSSPADIAIYGGAAGGGKTYALLMECLRHVGNGEFGAVVFRKQNTQIMAEGGLLDSAMRIYLPIGARFKVVPAPTAIFPSGAKISFRHLQYEREKHDWQGSQIPLLCFDELTHFSEGQFFYMLSRNRSTCGVRPYVRATCNPDADSWVARFIAWWIDQDTGYPIPERSGVVRYFSREDGKIVWSDSREELQEQFGKDAVKSVSFIASNIYDNKILLEADPGYLANLKALSEVQRERLLMGNWKIRPSAGQYFKREMFRVVHSVPDKIASVARAWDLAATTISPAAPNPDRTASCLMARLRNGQYIILDVQRRALGAADVRQLLRNTAEADRVQYPGCRVMIPQDPGQAGKDQAASLVHFLAGYGVKTHTVTGSKITRAEPFAAQVQHGAVMVMAGAWNEEFFDELEGFPDAMHDDQVDAASDAFQAVCKVHDWSGLIR